MTIDEIIDNFSLMGDWEERYQYLISLSARLPVMEDSLKTETAKVKGCISQVWMLLGWNAEGGLTMLADSDAQIVRGLVYVLRVMVEGKTAQEITSLDVSVVFSKLGLDTHLSPNRRNGFFSMVERVKGFAVSSRQT
jgi:cysteine desulfuration protein SufE